MLSNAEATKIVKAAFPTGEIQARVDYKNLHLFQVFRDEPGEEEMDPFFSVNRETGELKDFSIILDGDIGEITQLFVDAKERKR